MPTLLAGQGGGSQQKPVDLTGSADSSSKESTSSSAQTKAPTPRPQKGELGGGT